MNICIFGDSITWGASDSEQGGWANRLRNYFEPKDAYVYVLGIPGDTTVGLLSRIEAEARVRDPKIIIFAIGVNDAQFVHSLGSSRVPLDEFQEHLARLVAIARKFTDHIVFVGLGIVDEYKTRPIPWDSDISYLNADSRRFDAVIKNFCGSNGINYIPMDTLLTKDDLADGLHPNAVGHTKMFGRIRPEIESLGIH